MGFFSQREWGDGWFLWGFQPITLIKAYIGQGLRADLERLEGGIEISALIESLRKKGVQEEIISSALTDAQTSAQNPE
jgi:hypothetical protein